MVQRIVLGVEYDGSGYSGWQWQTGAKTVQSELQKALSKVAAEDITVICAGRTDAGVHALEQVVHFDTEAVRDLHSWLMGGNSHLPDQVRIVWAQYAIADFHARYSAIARFYRYIILNRKVKSALLAKQSTWCYRPLDEQKMHQAAQYLIGEHDFSSFRAQGCQSKSPRRFMYFINVYRQDERVIMDISANAFLHHMVRNIAGVLIEIGTGEKPINWTHHLLKVKERKQGGVTAPAEGLYLGAVFYPKQYGIEKHPVFKQLPVDAKRFD